MGDHGGASRGLALTVELQDLYESLRDIRDGELATYIPPLADADPSLFGLAIVTVDGHCYAAGDTATAIYLDRREPLPSFAPPAAAPVSR